MHDFSEAVMKANLDQIDANIDQMLGLLDEEMVRLSQSFDNYIIRINRSKKRVEVDLALKLDSARQIFENAKVEVTQLKTLIHPLQNIKEVNKLIRFAFQNQELIPTYMETISHICLGQLKYIKTKYQAVLSLVRSQIIKVWRSREVSEAIRLVLTVNQLRFNHFLKIFHKVEVHYADISLSVQKTQIDSFQQSVVLRMVSNRLHSKDEQRIIETLFPDWTACNEKVA